MYKRSYPVKVSRNRGIVLPSVLWITILMIVVAVNYASAVQLNIRATDNMKTSTMLKFDAISGIYVALERLLSNPPGENTHYQLEINSNPVDIEVSPEALKINLNIASNDAIREGFIDAGIDPEAARVIAARVIDWRDLNHSLQPYGMEDAGYFADAKEYGAKDDRIEDLSELLLIADIDRDVFSRLSDHFTLYKRAARKIYTLTARASRSSGEKSYVTTAIVQITRHPRKPYRILKWQHNHG